MSHPHLNQRMNPYDSSDEENTLLSQIDDAYSITSQSILTPSYISDQRQNFVNPSTPSYTKSRKALNKMLKSRDGLQLMEEELNMERSRGRYLIVACIFMSIFCGVLFADRLPEDWRGSLIEILEKGRTPPDISDNKVDEAKKVDPLDAFKDGMKTGEDDDDHYSKYGSTYDQYKKTHNTKHSSPSQQSEEENKEVEDNSSHKSSEENEKKEDEENDEESIEKNNDSTSSNKSKEKARVKENEQQHIDNLSKYLKWNLPYMKDRDVPVYWHIPLTGTTLLDDILSRCYKLVQAADDMSLLAGHENDGMLYVVSTNSKRYVNVDLGSISGINRAKKLHLARSGAVGVIRTSYLYEAALLFESTAKYGKCFTLLRDPIQRSVEVFYKLKQSSENSAFKSMTLKEYVNSQYCEDNWMVRVLSNEMEGELNQKHLDLSKHILGRKFIVGLTEDFEESMRRFAKYFDWDEEVLSNDLQKCYDDLEVSTHVRNNDFTGVTGVTQVNKGDEVWEILKEKNNFDRELYKYAKNLYESQALYSRLL